ncbi:MAG: alpha/beta hydrolase [Kiritimatiellae bacterium]|nr:alpha/beta hydrolase [Kiritimatiellia bacterium]
MNFASLVAVLVFACAAFGGERQPLWPVDAMPDAQPHQFAAMANIARKKGFDPGEWRMPCIEWFAAPANPNGKCMILISGGSYNGLVDTGLVKQWSESFTALGFQCVNLVYRVPRPENLEFYRTAWEDGQRAVRLVRNAAAERHFDPEQIGIVSMSAGSHLATLLAASSETPAYPRIDAIDDTPAHVNIAIAFAPAFVLTDGYGTKNTRGGDAIDSSLSPCFKFDSSTCPMCLLHGGADPYSPIASTRIYRELRKRSIPAEIHLFPGLGHGAHGFARAIEFLRQMDWLGPLGDDVALMDRFPSDDARAIHEKQDLWPAGSIPDAQANQNIPYLEWHIPAKLSTQALLVLWSGGSYNGSSPNGFEVAPVRRFLNSKGMAVVTVDYRHPRPQNGLAKHTSAWQDAQRAIRLVRSEAAARGFDPASIGVMGSSAGGHLALMCAASSRSMAYLPVDGIDKTSCSVQWGVAVYPAYTLVDGKDSGALVDELVFDPATPPMLFLHGDADGHPAMASVKAWEKMRRMGIQSELHTLVRRGHCFQRAAAPLTASFNFMDRIWDFISANVLTREERRALPIH